MNRQIRKITAAVAAVLLGTSSVDASILVGTFVNSGVESITKIQQLINDYNTDFGASLPDVGSLVDKIEGDTGAADFEGVNLVLSDFSFYDQDNSGGTGLDIFNAAQVKFSLSGLGWNFNLPDLNVRAFEQLDGPTFDYYVSEDGVNGWSLWTAMDGLNPVYTDAGTGDSSITGSGFTRGVITDVNLDYDPIKNGISHISFYSSSTEVIPEPTTIVVWGG